MKQNLILTAVGPDRIGLVERISEFTVQHDCNIEDSKMAVFCGEFALILLLSGEEAKLSRLAGAADQLASLTGLNVWAKTPSARKPAGRSLPYKLTAACLDHPGVVYQLSRFLSQQGINIESLETKTYAAPISGSPIFRLEAILSIPGDLSVTNLRSQLEQIERQENIDVDLFLIE
jgi:glycine cleavage system transcriptional repressor